MYYTLRHQPIKGIYVLGQLLATTFIRIPLWILFAIHPSWRPRKNWTIKRVVWVNIVRWFWNMQTKTGPILPTPNHLSITKGRNVNGVWVAAVQHLVTGELASWAEDAKVSSVRVPGYWVHKKGASIGVAATPSKGEKVIYHLHGGAFVRHSAHPNDPVAAIGGGFLKNCTNIRHVFSVEYRLSTHKPYDIANPFPAALLDALAGYNYLVNTIGFSPSDIVVVGDSAGGNLALALTRYLIEYQNSPDIQLPEPPGHVVLLSPWADLSGSHDIPGSSAIMNNGVDYLGDPIAGGVDYAKVAYLGPQGHRGAMSNRYISPASVTPSMQVSFKRFPRTFIVAGGSEALYDQIVTLRNRMVRDIGEGEGATDEEGKVKFYVAPDAVHDYLIFEWHEPERTATYKEINEWINLVS
ncbi:hypothetical protein AMATHDRAFT_145470 [Amanita thiersii Skay4041]|uniref:Alpha/beta hydrolase fold-3 domain-containing protein n=1 Tax=Amanita thiersii Skay4041 TaxID=703135 RepID=A0A2A9NH07_9AGAR|nr:hypothetical protein AMATHDRAFT_145470 [Amanita thiersii Skay4041]